MGESVIPMPSRIDTGSSDDRVAQAIGLDVSGVMRYQMAVLDREDRLESGTGSWKATFDTDNEARGRAVRSSVLRTLRMAFDAEYFDILEALSSSGGLRSEALATATNIGKLTVHERVSDLVSAGLATKVPEADQVAITASGAAVVELVRAAAAVAGRDLKAGE